jgi:hypothetical protein
MPRNAPADDNEGDGDDFQERAEAIAREVVAAMVAGNAEVTLSEGGEVAGTIESFTVRKKENKKGKVNWAGSVKIQMEHGLLDVDLLKVGSVTPKPR